MAVAPRIREIVERALAGEVLGPTEIGELFQVPLFSEDAFYIQWAGREMSNRAANGKAEVHAQVGLDASPCPNECRFCSFAACSGVFKTIQTVPVEEVIAKAKAFEQDGANAIYLMITGAFKFEDFLKIAAEVRKSLRPETPLVANIFDFGYDEALALREMGFAGIYHAVRLGEGRETGIPVAKRLATIEAAHRAGLKVSTCLEPIGPEHSIDELVEKTLICREIKPVFAGAGRRINFPGSKMGHFGMTSEAQLALFVAVVRLAMGYTVSFNCTHEPNTPSAIAGANILWAEAGSNPRDTTSRTETSRGFSVPKCRQILEEAEWAVHVGPSEVFRTEAVLLE